MRYLNMESRASRMFFSIWVMGLFVVFFSSCSKDSSGEGAGPASVTISVTGVSAEDIEGGETRAGASLVDIKDKGNYASDKKTVKIGDFEMDFISSEEDDLSFGKSLSHVHQSIFKRASGGNRAADELMESGVQYWFVLYNKTTKNFEHSIRGYSGVPLQLDVVKNQDYDWYAYSYNSYDPIPSFNTSNLLIESAVDMPLLYAKGTFKATAVGVKRLGIIFKHQLKQIKIELDTRGLFGDINIIKGVFNNASYIKKGVFNVVTGAFVSTSVVPTGNFVFEDVDVQSKRRKFTRFYTADFSQNQYGIKFSQLSVKLPNGNVHDLGNPVNGQIGTSIFSFATTGKGKVHHAKLNLWKRIPMKSILHIEGDAIYSYAASQANKASGAFLRSTTNFGNTSNYLRIAGFTHEIIGSGTNVLRNRLADPANYPDIIIAGMYTGFQTADYTALKKYLDRGGAVFLMIENKTAYVDAFFVSVFGAGVSAIERDGGGAIYKIENVDGDVLGWPFADVRNGYWGQDGSRTLYVENLSPAAMNDIVVYTRSSVNATPVVGANKASMFRHKKLNFFFMGDTGALSNPLSNGIYGPSNIWGRQPFSTDASNFPITRTYGAASVWWSLEPNIGYMGWNISNAALFGNVFAMLVAQSHYDGLDRSP